VLPLSLTAIAAAPFCEHLAGKVRTAIKRQSITLDRQQGHIFSVLLQGLDAFDAASAAKDSGVSAKRTVLTFELPTSGDRDAVKIVGRWTPASALRFREPILGFRRLLEDRPLSRQFKGEHRLVLKELLRGLILDRSTQLSRNHAMDFLHAVVPVAYCDYVMLDKYWEDQVRRMRQRLTPTSIDIPLARVLSKRTGGLEELVRSLEGAAPG